jgi:hypothetical protein
MPTEQPFTVMVCRGCPTESGQTPPVEVLDAVGSHGVLISVPCLLGPAFCTGRPGGGVLAAVQACTVDRIAVGPAHLVGPIRRRAEMAYLCKWLQSGRWTRRPRPFFTNGEPWNMN